MNPIPINTIHTLICFVWWWWSSHIRKIAAEEGIISYAIFRLACPFRFTVDTKANFCCEGNGLFVLLPFSLKLRRSVLKQGETLISTKDVWRKYSPKWHLNKQKYDCKERTTIDVAELYKPNFLISYAGWHEKSFTNWEKDFLFTPTPTPFSYLMCQIGLILTPCAKKNLPP